MLESNFPLHAIAGSPAGSAAGSVADPDELEQRSQLGSKRSFDSLNTDDGHRLMRPRTLGRILELARTVLHCGTIAESIFEPCRFQDQAMKLLLRDQVVMWCWRTWQDNRVADFETIVAMVS